MIWRKCKHERSARNRRIYLRFDASRNEYWALVLISWCEVKSDVLLYFLYFKLHALVDHAKIVWAAQLKFDLHSLVSFTNSKKSNLVSQARFWWKNFGTIISIMALLSSIETYLIKVSLPDDDADPSQILGFFSFAPLFVFVDHCCSWNEDFSHTFSS